MPFYKTKILNREISLEYEKKDEKKIIDSINLINERIDNKLQNPKYSNGKISDTILLSLLSIELQAELSEKINIQRSSEINDAKNEEYLKNNLELKDKIIKLFCIYFRIYRNKTRHYIDFLKVNFFKKFIKQR